MGILRPRERLLLNALKKEADIRYRGRRMHKRFRSWAQQRVRHYWLPQKVCITSDPQLMDGNYIAASVQKAATLRKHDLELWHGFSKRILELADCLTPQQMGYIFYGYGKSLFRHEELYRGLLPYVVEALPDFHSHALMTVAWALERVRVNDRAVVAQIAEEALAKKDTMRPADFIKIVNCVARMGAAPPSLASALSEELMRVLDEKCSALLFRGAVDHVAVANLYSDPLRLYVLERFTKTAMCCRPMHYQKAFQSAVAIRVLHPHVWQQLSKAVRNFYIRLSWGCFWIDIGEIDDRRQCWFVDGPSDFYSSTNEYTEANKLQHRILSELGWSIRRVRWNDWVHLGTDMSAKVEFLRKLRERPPWPSILTDGPRCSRQEMLASLKSARDVQRILKERRERNRQPHSLVMNLG
ncbi:conserved hypothetical protein [Neospora caninum Liverpool]|uniref:RAP domain-containing protein n=1 Tax=Neospora caninum (strain Liverpool) TaxID=572307 RepID=F0VGK4_NEOCL|nr:conserved hypothetical protein [Neospora caninum Liverpool]CBZ52848.1 conserved hypothetical protein [Neospora caninum Liverpool]|eukprot:XP_003882880.1 conserved hypothetical protein [Neospora caninum Liverpool]